MASREGAPSNRRHVTKLPRGAGFDKVSTKRHLVAMTAFPGSATKYAVANGMNINTLVTALQRHYPQEWQDYLSRRGGLPTRQCAYCHQDFIPASIKQKACTRKCASHYRSDQDYFGGKRRHAIGIDTGTCQLCERTNVKGLSAHHIIGKENDPENDMLIAVCQGCHKLITLAASRTFIDNARAWENFISLVWLRKHGSELAARSEPFNLYTYVEIEDERMSDEEQSLLIPLDAETSSEGGDA
jgi:hypothetical protein